MLTRLQVKGFKNLEDVDVQLGPFTCVTGPNGVGKSNLFDTIAFLSALASRTLAEAAAAVRGTQGRIGDVRSLFRNDAGERAPEMSFLAEMIIPKEGTDDLGSEAHASMTFLRYQLVLRHREDSHASGPLEVVREELEHINKTGADEVLGFPSSAVWRDSVITGRRTVPYIETIVEQGKTVVLTRADSEVGSGSGGFRRALAAQMPRTVLSTANNAAEHRTLVLTRAEMMGWTQFQLEPSALRAPDTFSASPRIGPNGAHLPAALFRLARAWERSGQGEARDIYQRIANRLAELYENARSLRVDQDEKRELLSIVLEDLQGTEHLASSLSDGTLRFLALAILEASAEGPSVLCLEEPENGIHPDRIPAIIQLLQDIAVDVDIEVGPENPLRQVIINTHSPGVVNAVPEDTLVVAEAEESSRDGQLRRSLRLRGLKGTWRKRGGDASIIPLLAYMSPVREPPEPSRRRERRLSERTDVQQLALFNHPLSAK